MESVTLIDLEQEFYIVQDNLKTDTGRFIRHAFKYTFIIET